MWFWFKNQHKPILGIMLINGQQELEAELVVAFP